MVEVRAEEARLLISNFLGIETVWRVSGWGMAGCSRLHPSQLLWAAVVHRRGRQQCAAWRNSLRLVTQQQVQQVCKTKAFMSARSQW